MPSLLLVRHAQGSFGAADYDVLSQIGAAQSAALAREVTRRGLVVTRIVSGGLVRQRETIAPLAAASGVEYIVDPRWDEYDTDDVMSSHSNSTARPWRGEGSGAAVSSREFQDLLDGALLSWIAAGDEGHASEQWPQFAARSMAALCASIDGLGRGATAVVCTSGGVLAAIAVVLLGLPAETFVRFSRVAVNAGITTVVSGAAGMTLVSFNEHGHLTQSGHPSLATYR